MNVGAQGKWWMLPGTTSGLQFEPITHTYTYDGVVVPSVTQAMRPLNQFHHVPEGRLMAAAERGTAVHSLCEQYDGNTLDVADVPEELAGYVLSWTAFREETGFEPMDVERRVYHAELGYAGTLDRAGWFRGEWSVLDIKTSARLGPAVGVQLAAYQAAYNHGQPPRHQIRRRFAVHLKKDGTYEAREYKGALDFRAFVACLDLYRWARQASLKGEPITEPTLHRYAHTAR